MAEGILHTNGSYYVGFSLATKIIIFFDKVFTFMFRFTVDELKRDAKQKTNINSMKDLRLSPTFVQQCWILSEQLFCDIVVHNAIHIVIGCTEYRDFLKK